MLHQLVSEVKPIVRDLLTIVSLLKPMQYPFFNPAIWILYFPRILFLFDILFVHMNTLDKIPLNEQWKRE